MEILSKIYRRSPQECLDTFFEREKERLRSGWNGSVFLWQSCLGVDGVTTYGSYKTVTKEYLSTREYRIEFWDGKPSIFWTDVLHDPKTCRSVPKTEHEVTKASELH